MVIREVVQKEYQLSLLSDMNSSGAAGGGMDFGACMRFGDLNVNHQQAATPRGEKKKRQPRGERPEKSSGAGRRMLDGVKKEKRRTKH